MPNLLKFLTCFWISRCFGFDKSLQRAARHFGSWSTEVELTERVKIEVQFGRKFQKEFVRAWLE